MSIKRTLIILTGAVLSALAPLALSGTPSVALVEAYYAALREGDVGTMASLLGEPLLGIRGPMLRDPQYPEYLRETYRGRGHEIIDVAPFDARPSEAVVVLELLEGDEVIRLRYVVRLPTEGGDGQPGIVDITPLP